MRSFKNFLKEFFVFLVIFSLVCWSLGVPLTTFVPEAQAYGDFNTPPLDDGGSPDIYLSSSSIPEAIMKITVYDTAAGTNRLNNLTIEVMPGMNCDAGSPPVCTDSPFTVTDFGAITATASSGISVWQDDGDGVFELYADTLVSNTVAKQASDWLTSTTTDDYSGMSWVSYETTFSDLDLTITDDYNAPLTVFVVARAQNNIDADPLHRFMPNIPQYGVDVTSASLSDWPSDTWGHGFMQVTLAAEGSGDFMQYSSPIVISEIQIATSSAASVEFVELYNDSDQSYDLFPSNGTDGADDALSEDLRLHYVSSSGADVNKTLTLSANNDAMDDIAAKSYFLLATSEWEAAWSTSYGQPSAIFSAGLAADGAVYISHSDTATTSVIDMVGWGANTKAVEGMAAVAPPTNGSIERKAFPDSTPSSMTTGIDADKGNGEDSNNNSADFITRPAIAVYPQTASSTAETGDIEDNDRDVVINEIFYNTSAGNGWIELYNASSTAINLNDWILEVATSTVQTYTLPADYGTLAANSFLVIYWNRSGTDVASSTFASNKTDIAPYGGDVTLKDSSENIKDYFQYGGSGKAGESAAVSAGQWTSGDFRPGCGWNESLSRSGTSGDDHNTSGDWVLASSPTRGYPNSGGDSTSPTAVTNVVLSDPDPLGYGITGDDIRISWVPSGTSDNTFDRYEIYLLPDATSLDTAQHAIYSTIYGQYLMESGTASTSYAFIGSPGQPDSAGTALAESAYRAYVVAVDTAGNRSASVGSAAFTPTDESAGVAGDDTSPPMIDHMSVWEAKEGATLTFYARMGDDRGLATAELAFRTADPDTTWGNATSTCTAPAMASSAGLYACSVAFDGSWNADTTLYYYLRALDDAGNDQYVGMYPIDTEATVKNNPIDIDFVAAADWNDGDATADLTGTIFDEAGAPVQDAFVYVNGIAAVTATTTSAGVFTIPDDTMRHSWNEVKIIKAGYWDQFRNVEKNSTGNDFYLGTGYMSTSDGGSTGGNGIAWTAPMEGMMMAPTNISCTGDCSTIGSNEMPIVIGFFNDMDSATVNDNDASNAGSNIYLTTDGNTKVSNMKVIYESNNSEARIYSSTALSPNTFYTVVITPNVLDTNGNPVESNRPSGNYEFSFNTMGDTTDLWGSGGDDYTDFGGGGMYMPPYVVGTNPTPGQYQIPLGTVLTVEFSEPMDPSVINSVKLYPISSESSWTVGTVISASTTLDNATKKIVTIDPVSILDANAGNNGWYEIRIMGNAKSQMGIWMGDPSSCGEVSPDTCLANTVHYSSSFQVASAAETVRPTISGTFPANNDGITNSSYADVALPAIKIGFSEGMNPGTINNKSITLKKGTVSISGTVSYDAMSNNAKYAPNDALAPNSVYTLTASTSITDLSGNALDISSGNNIVSFKTGSADTAAPEVMFANGDDYQVAITFNEPMNAATQGDTTNWAFSVLNPDNYYINTLGTSAGCSMPGSWSCNQNLVAPYNTADGNQISSLSNITLSYNSETQTVTLQGFTMCSGQDYAQCTTDPDAVFDFQIFVDNVKDKSGNAIADSTNRSGDPTHRNASRSPMQNSAETYGMLGPGGGPNMMMSGDMSMDMGKMGMFGAGAFPMNAMAGQTSMYMIDVPVTKALQDGMQVVITFPSGFNVSGVAKDPYSPMNNDMNEWNGGTVTFDNTFGVGGIASTTSNVITIKLDISTTTSQLNTSAGPDGFIDFLAIDLKGITNSSIPKDFGTSGYIVDIKTKSSDGGLLENIETMPFFITEGGSDSLTVIVNCGDTDQDTGTMNIFLGSMMTGPMEAESTTFSDGIATSTFTNLISGGYMIFTDPFITIDGNNYLGSPMPEPIQVSGASVKNITIEKEEAGAGKTAVNVYLVGDYSTGGNADDVDVFAGSPSGFRVKTLSNVGDTNPNTTLYLTEGDWMMGVGPAMPKGPMAGPPPMPDWMEPQMVNLVVGIEAATATSGAAAVGNALTTTLDVQNTDNFHVGDVVTFATGAAAATTTITSLSVNTSITVTPQGNWTTLPLADDTIISVRELSNGDNDAKVYFNISTQTLKQIQGFVVDDSNNALGDVEVYAYQPQGFGGGHTTTDTSGKFSLKIGNNGIWTIGAFKPGLPDAKQKSVEVKDDSSNVATDGNSTADVYLNGTLIADANSDNSGTNPLRLKLKRPGYTISGKVLNASDQAVPYAPVWAYQPTSWGHADTMTDASGNYILYVDNGTWRIETDAPGVGWLQYDTDVTINNASQSNINLKPSSDTTFYSVSGTVSINDANQTYMPLRAVLYDANGVYQGRDYGASTDSNGQFTFSLPAGLYRIDTWTPDYGEIELVYDQLANSPANINVNAATTTANITVASGDLQTVSIQFNNGTASQTGFLHVEEMDFSSGYPRPTGYHFSTDISGLSATTTIKLKGAASGKYYFFDLDVPGAGFFIPNSASRALLTNPNDCIKVIDADRAVYFDLPNASTGMLTVSGTVTDGTNNLANAWVWLGNPNSHFHTGSETDSNGAFSITAPVLSSGSYNLGADKPGFMSPAPATVSGTASSTANTVTLAANTLTITGYIYTDADSNGSFTSTTTESIPNAWVWAEETSTGRMTHSPADANGAYELGVSNGTWQVYAGADGYNENAYRVSNTKTTTAISGSSVSGINVALSTNSNWTMKTKSKPITPANGGTIDDTASSSTGVKITIPPNALGSDSNSGNVSVTETSAVTKTTSAEPLGGIGKTITATDNSGNAITNLNDYIDIEIVYYAADIAAMSLVDYSKLKTHTLSYWDDSLNNWVSLATTRKAYYKLLSSDTEWNLKPDNATTTQTGYEEFIDTLVAETPTYYDYKLVFTAKTNHLTVFGATNPPDAVSPSSPTGLAQSSGSGTSVGLSWTAVTTNSDATAITDLLGYEMYRSTDNSTYTQLNTSDITPTSYSDTTTSAFTSYYYKVTAADDGGNETTLANSTALQVCSTNSVSNGTVAASCAITCNSGYTTSGNTCVSSGGSVINTTPQGQAESADTTTETETVTEVVEEIITETKETISEAVDTATQAAQEFAQKIVTIAAEAVNIVKANVNALLGKLGIKRNLAKEQVSVKKYVKALIKDVAGLPEQSQHALTNFISYGTDTTQILGEGERAGVINSYKSAFAKLPITQDEWNDAIKIANGRWPSQTSQAAEDKATINFKAVYLREPDRSSPHDDAAVTVMAYGLRPADRNLGSEKAAIKIFKAIYGYNPATAIAWDVVRAIAYSGATR